MADCGGWDGGEPPTGRPPHALARSTGHDPPQAPFDDQARQEDRASPRSGQPRLPRRCGRHELVGNITALPTGESWLYLLLDLATWEVGG